MKNKIIEIGATILLPERESRIEDIESTVQLFQNYISEIIVKPNGELWLVDTFVSFIQLCR